MRYAVGCVYWPHGTYTSHLSSVSGGSLAATYYALKKPGREVPADLSDLPAACKEEENAPKTPEEVRDRIAEIPTRLVLNSACDRQLLAVAARKLVAEHTAEILNFINRP